MEERDYGKEIENLSLRAKLWGSLLATSCPPITEASHTAIDRLLNDNIPDGALALELALVSLSASEREGLLIRIMEESLIVGREKAQEILKNCLKGPNVLIREAAEKCLHDFDLGKYDKEKTCVLGGTDDEVRRKINVLIEQKTRQWKN